MKKLLTVLAALAIGVSCATAADAAKKAAAKGGAHDPAETFKKLDTNGDGFLSLEEFKAGPMGKKDPSKAEEVFKKKDTNGDGKLSLEEFEAHGGKKGAAAPAATPAAATTVPPGQAPTTPAVPDAVAPAK